MTLGLSSHLEVFPGGSRAAFFPGGHRNSELKDRQVTEGPHVFESIETCRNRFADVSRALDVHQFCATMHLEHEPIYPNHHRVKEVHTLLNMYPVHFPLTNYHVEVFSTSSLGKGRGGVPTNHLFAESLFNLNLRT